MNLNKKMQLARETLNEIETDYNNKVAKLAKYQTELEQREIDVKDKETKTQKLLKRLDEKLIEAGGVDGVTEANKQIADRVEELNKRERVIAESEQAVKTQLTQLQAIDARLKGKETKQAERETALNVKARNMRKEIIEEVTQNLSKGL